METQYPVSAANKWYFIDIAIPAQRIGIEFDGRGKYGSDVDSVHRSIEAEERRQRGSGMADPPLPMGSTRPPRGSHRADSGVVWP